MGVAQALDIRPSDEVPTRSLHIITTLCILAVVGCSGNQQKLEECMNSAAITYLNVSDYSSAALGCASKAQAEKPGSGAACAEFDQRAKCDRLEAEERCVKLYK